MMPASVCTRTHRTLANSSVRNVSMAVIFTACLPGGWRSSPGFLPGNALVECETGEPDDSLAPSKRGDHRSACKISQHVYGRHQDGSVQRVPRLRRRDMAKRPSRPRLVAEGETSVPPRRNRINLFELAYHRIEELLVKCELAPGRFLAMQDLQDLTGFGRTPVHHAVNRLAADTLIII